MVLAFITPSSVTSSSPVNLFTVTPDATCYPPIIRMVVNLSPAIM
jgi:hypothetical protein